MKQISEGDTTTSSRPAFRGLTAASLMATHLLILGMTAVDLYHSVRFGARWRGTYTVRHVSAGPTRGGFLPPSSHQRGPDRRHSAPTGQGSRTPPTRRPLRPRPGPLRWARGRGDAGPPPRHRWRQPRPRRVRGTCRAGPPHCAPLGGEGDGPGPHPPPP